MSNQIQIETQKDRDEKVLPVKSISNKVSNIELVKQPVKQIELVSDSEDSSSASEIATPHKRTPDLHPRASKHTLPPAFANTLMNPLKARIDREPEVTDQYYSDSEDSYESSSGDEAAGPIPLPSSNPVSSLEPDKQEIFIKLMALKNKGVILSNNFTPKSDYTELKLEYERQNNLLRNEAGVKFARRMLMGCVTGMEFMNKKFDPIGAKLDGWSENVMENIGEYDNVFEKLYEKYSSDTEMAPEFQLMFTLGGSAFMFHLTNTMFKSNLPNVTQPAYIPPVGSIPSSSAQTAPSAGANIFRPSTVPKPPPPDMKGPSDTVLSGLPDISNALKNGPSIPTNSRPEFFSGNAIDGDRFSDGTDSKLSDLSEIRSVSINMGSGSKTSGKNKITIGKN